MFLHSCLLLTWEPIEYNSSLKLEVYMFCCDININVYSLSIYGHSNYISFQQNIPCLSKIRTYLLEKCPEAMVERLTSLLSQANVGFLIKAQMVSSCDTFYNHDACKQAYLI